MRTILIGLGVVAIGIILIILFITANFTYRVDAGQVGLLVDYAQRGKDGSPQVTIIPPGSFIWYNSLNRQAIFEYPVSLQTLSLVARPNEGDTQGDDSVTFTTAQGIPLKIDVTAQWRVTDPARLYFLMPNVPLTGSFNNDVSTKLVRQNLIHALTNSGSTYQWQDIASHENTMSAAMKTELQPVMARYGIEIEQISLGQPHYNQQQQVAIDSLTTAQQDALKAQFEKQKQEYLAQAAQISAQSQAKQIEIINQQLARSSEYLKYKEIEKWDGKLPSALSTDGDPILAPFQK